MRAKIFLLVSAVLLLLATACTKSAPESESSAPSSTSAPDTGTAQPPAGGVAPATASPPAGPATSEPSGAAPAAAAPESVLASQETSWSGVVAEVTEFRRKGNTLTARVRLRNQGSAAAQPEVKYDEVYLMDLAAGKKYQVLADEAGSYIAALRSGWKDRWYGELAPGQGQLLWMKFPAPPAEVRSVTLQIPGVPPFEDLAIQDS
ncbi:MAG TPA: hypothetical protein VH394_01250 [Thermoanaerobaculia bacterium]|jgi:hypothetical protein|nr:hypothetical protein [Thermoanaerobaculia bacterium]